MGSNPTSLTSKAAVMPSGLRPFSEPSAFLSIPAMLFALFTGVILGFAPLGILVALPLLAVALAVKGFIDIRYVLSPVIRRPSPFQIYCYNLEQRGEQTRHAHVSYILQLMVFGMLAGGAAMGLVRHFL